jgi:hypothetical protein
MDHRTDQDTPSDPIDRGALVDAVEAIAATDQFGLVEKYRADVLRTLLAAPSLAPHDPTGPLVEALQTARLELIQDVDPDAVIVGIDRALAQALTGETGDTTPLCDAPLIDGRTCTRLPNHEGVHQ